MENRGKISYPLIFQFYGPSTKYHLTISSILRPDMKTYTEVRSGMWLSIIQSKYTLLYPIKLLFFLETHDSIVLTEENRRQDSNICH